jgi:hypothetical protein
MVSEIFDYIIIEMGTLIGHNGKWTSKSCKNVFVYKLGGYWNSVGIECSSFHPLYYVINGYKNVSIA